MVGSAVRSRSPRLRADATRNRERIVAAAREAFVEHGAEVPLDEVARRAGVGNATLYRHFADKAELVREVVLSVMARVTERTEAAVAQEPDAFEALRRFVFESAEDRVGALCPMLSEAFDSDHPAIFAASDRLNRSIEDIMDRARSSGQLRPDIAVGDLMVAITQLTRPLPGKACMDMDRFVHRHLQIFLDGLRAPARSALPGTAVTLEELQQQR
ncbi:TetR/AcrR family transcriptional regulator [Streptomyces sp. SPB162]|uniref:TetR/AcrR family transcriptional regulator n=1 Tax=Streptomyces sp. SPB162 TaxID=2940560 RepID=UPI002406B89E|nr:TetR/AcrR family transcriptional regulator [Streptomyces sp. SPB162]MDF9813717.1 AcrR family transcriptional regulator [Streptomyces sp. SPB162]